MRRGRLGTYVYKPRGFTIYLPAHLSNKCQLQSILWSIDNVEPHKIELKKNRLSYFDDSF